MLPLALRDAELAARTGQPLREDMRWVSNGEPARVTAETLKRSVLRLAVACLLKRHYPGEGSRHEGALVIGGALARARWTANDIAHVIAVAARATGDDDVSDRVAAAKSAVEIKANDHDVAGLNHRTLDRCLVSHARTGE
jgi:hypothetical protein